MKVVFICSGFPIISEMFIYNKIRLLLENNIDINIITPHVKKELALSDAQNLPHFHDFQWQNIILYIEGDTLLKQEMYFKKYILPRLQNTDIFHFEYMIEFWEFFFKYLPPSIPKIAETHGYDFSIDFNKRLNKLRKLIHNYDAIVVKCGEASLRANIIKGDNSKPSIHIFNPGIDLREFKKRKISGNKTTDDIYIISIARLVEKKGLEFLIRAMPRVIKKHPNVRLKLIGDGHLREYLFSIVKELKLCQSVFFENSRYPFEIIEELQKADIFILPCVIAKNGDIDTAPNVLQEAQAIKIPVISSWLSGIPEIVDHGKSGILVQPKDIKGLANAINLLIERPDLRKSMGEYGRKKIEEKLDANKQIHQYIKLYSSLIKKNK